MTTQTDSNASGGSPSANSPRAGLLRTAAWLGAVTVIVGAFGAHALESAVPPKDLEIWRTAVRYQAWHTLVLLVLAMLPAGWRRVTLTARLLVAGIVLFSGSLYTLVLTDVRALGAVTPLGGTLLIAGWIALATSGPRRAHS